jgi:hypothetical protein
VAKTQPIYSSTDIVAVTFSSLILISLSRENRQARQTCDHIKTHSTMTKQDGAMRFSRRSSSNSLLEGNTCRAPLCQRNGGLFSTFGYFPDSPRISHCYRTLLSKPRSFLRVNTTWEVPERSRSAATVYSRTHLLCVFVYLMLLITVVYHGLPPALALQFAYSL